MNLSRRELLAAVGPGTSIALAGCSGQEGDGETTTGRTETTGAATAETTESTTSEETAADESATTTDAKTATVIAADNQFDPVRLSVAPGTTVTWDNRESGTYGSHSVKSAQFHETAAKWSFEKDLPKGGSVSHTFDEAGVYEYYCTVHGEGSMCGVVLVGDVSLSKSLPCEDSGTTTDDGYGGDY